MKKHYLYILFIGILWGLNSCMDDERLRDFARLKAQEKTGVFVINEGNFNNNNASLSFYHPQDKKNLNDVFYNTNALPLGDVAQSMTIQDSLAYVVINNSGKIYIFNKHTFSYTGKIVGLSSPRYIHFVSKTKAYISDLYAKAITIVDPITRSIIGHINLDNHESNYYQHSTEQMVQVDDKVFVNCWSYDNKVLVINSVTDSFEDSITVGKQPNSMLVDKNKRLWVLSDGGFEGSSYGQEKAQLVCINTSDFSVEKRFVFDDIDASPSHLQTNTSGDTLYFLYTSWANDLSQSGVWAMSINSQTLPSTAMIPQANKTFYALGVDKQRYALYVSDAKDFSQNGTVYRYTMQANLIDQFKVGINPGNFCFLYE